MDPWIYNNRQTVDYPQFLQSLVQQQAATNPIIQYNNEQRTQPPSIASAASFTPKPAHQPLNCNWQQTSESNQIRSSFEPYQTIAAAGTNQIFANPPYALQQTLNLAAAAQTKSESANNQNSLYRQSAGGVDSQSAANKQAVNNQTSGTPSPNSNHIKQENMYNINRNFDKSRIVNPPNAGNAETNFEVPFTPAKAYNNPQSQFFLIQQEQERKANEARQEHEPLYLYRTTPAAMTIFNTARNLLAANNVAADRIKIETPYGPSVPQNDVSNAVVITRRPSPAQSNNSQISSPVYPPYNSPMNSVESPSQNSTGSSQPSDNAGHIVIYKTNQQQAHQQAAVSSPIVYPYPVITHNPRTHDPYSSAAIKPQGPTYNNNAQSTQIGALHNPQKEAVANQVTENIVVSTQCPLASQIQLKVSNQQQHQQQQQQQQHSQQQTVVESTPPAQTTPTTKGRRRKTPVSKAQQQQQQQQHHQQQQQQQQQAAQHQNQQQTNGVNNTPLQLFSNQLTFTNTQLQKQQQQAMMSALLPSYTIQMPDIQIQQSSSGKESSNDHSATAQADEELEDDPKPKVVLQSIEDEFPELNIKLPKPEKMQKNANGATFIDSYLKFLDEQTAPAQQAQAAGGGRKGSQKPIVTSVQVVSNPALQPQANLNHTSSGVGGGSGESGGAHDELQNQPIDNIEVKKPKWRRKKNNAANVVATTSYESNQVEQQQQQQQEQVYRSQLPKKACPQIATQMPTSTATTSTAYNTSPFQQNAQVNPQMQMQPSHPWSNLNPEPVNLPRRETTSRKAKSKGIEDLIATTSGENDEEAFADSDCDPVWTPQDDEEYDEEPQPSKRKPRKPKSTTRCKQRANILSAAVLGAGILDDSSDDDEDEDEEIKKRKRQTGIKVSDKFNVGDFVILTSEQFSKTPVLWQIDSKSILQKYEPFMEGGNLFYRSKQMFTTWRSNSVEFYTKVQVHKCFQNGDEKIVKLILSPAQIANAEFTEKIMNEYTQFSDHFRVYVQALISQSLHNDFLSDVGDDDDFFHPNIAVIDHNVEQCRQKVIASLKWPVKITAAIETWPVYRIISEMEMDKYQCSICRELAGITFSLNGDVYDRKTMKVATYYPPAASYNKNITMCHKCITHAESLHKIVHTKFNLLQLCSKRVQDLLENAKDPHEILRELLTDSTWISDLFANVRSHWTEAHNIERLSQLNELMGMLPQLQ